MTEINTNVFPRARPLLTTLVIVHLIASTSTITEAGITVACRLTCEQGIKVSDAEMARLNIHPAAFHGEWNHTIRPGPPDG